MLGRRSKSKTGIDFIVKDSSWLNDAYIQGMSSHRLAPKSQKDKQT